METKKKAWLYCRIDAPEDARGILKTQKRELLFYAEQMGFEVVGSSYDLGSGPMLERPGLAECMDSAAAGKMDVLIVKRFLRGLNQLGVTLYSPLEGAFPFEQAPGIRPAIQPK